MTNKNCARCEKTVYPIEELKCLDKVWHKTCFKCHECGMILNMKTYKGFNKLPYCNAHCPQARATTVAETPESRRLAENTKIQSNIKYHEDFERQKGKLTQVADDPETLRIRNTSKIISNATYHGEYEKKKQMEERRTLITGEDNTYNNNINAAVYHQYSSTSNMHNNQSNMKDQQHYVKTPIANVAIIDNHQRNQMYSNNNNNNFNQTDFSNKNYYTNKISGSSGYYSQPQEVGNTRVGVGYSTSGMIQTNAGHPQIQQQQYQQSNYQPKQMNLHMQQIPTQYHQQQQQQKDYYHPNDYPQVPICPTMVPNYNNHIMQQTQSQQILKPSIIRKPNLGICVRAIYDYTAQDVDEVTFMDGDLIVNCEPIDDGWMTGTVQRTGETGMLPSNYVETV